MNYFTPELIACGQTRDEDLLNRHEEEWDEICTHYETYLDSIRPSMPPGVQRLLADYYLHDAIIRGVGQGEQLFVIMVQLDTPPRSLVTLHYDLVEDPVILHDALPVELHARGGMVDWQYDEIEMVQGDPPTWRHCILLNNGWEIRLHFQDVRIVEIQALIPSPSRGSQSALASSA